MRIKNTNHIQVREMLVNSNYFHCPRNPWHSSTLDYELLHICPLGDQGKIGHRQITAKTSNNTSRISHNPYDNTNLSRMTMLDISNTAFRLILIPFVQNSWLDCKSFEYHTVRINLSLDTVSVHRIPVIFSLLS